MNKLKLLYLVCLFSTASFAQATDSTTNNAKSMAVAEQKSQIATVSTDQKYLNKQVNIRKEKTTWTKIKDLFM